jgi:AcrR family transcriptional regulator
MAQRTYHHGDLRRALLDAAIEAITEAGPAAMSLRDLARRAGVSHAGPTHHFRDKPGLLTALATEGYDLLATALTTARAETGNALELGLAYVQFAGGHRAHFEVMFRPDLYRAEDAALIAARGRATEALCGAPMDACAGAPGSLGALGSDRPDGLGDSGGGGAPAGREAGLAAWTAAHGFAVLWLSGALPLPPSADPADAARQILRRVSPEL